MFAEDARQEPDPDDLSGRAVSSSAANRRLRAKGRQAPADEELLDGLDAVFGRLGDAPVTVLERFPAPPEGSSVADVVLCRIADGRRLRLFCKYAAPRNHQRYGHRGGVSRESSIYRNLFTAPGTPQTVHFYGHHIGLDGRDWLILEYLDHAQRLVWTADPAFMYAAARWIGEFHASQQTPSDLHSQVPLKPYDAAYYMGWVRRTRRYSLRLSDELPWISEICDLAPHLLQPLLESSNTAIHGEYYPKNIMVQDARVYPVDWESAAIAAGEIDLASLTERWPPQITDRCRRAYVDARWPSGAPERFADALLAARIYLHFRWLGDRPAWTTAEHLRWRFGDLQALAEAAGRCPPSAEMAESGWAGGGAGRACHQR